MAKETFNPPTYGSKRVDVILKPAQTSTDLLIRACRATILPKPAADDVHVSTDPFGRRHVGLVRSPSLFVFSSVSVYPLTVYPLRRLSAYPLIHATNPHESSRVSL